MQRKKALQLMRDWINRRCEHPNIENEFSFGKETGNKVCTICGRTIYAIVYSKGAEQK
jgi:tRNA(Ile)-lysidine synthase TilS/MesJ